jgi:LAGLIDADG DNA endonuclease family
MTTDNQQFKPELFQIVTGNLLGDGNLQKPKGCQFYRFRFSQNFEHADYINHLLKKYKKGVVIRNPFNNKQLKLLVKRNIPRKYQSIQKRN